MKRLAHTHERDVSNPPVLDTQLLIGLNDLVEDLVRGEAVRHAHCAGRAEATADGATNLGGNTQGRSACGDAQDDRFDQEALGCSEDKLARTISAGVLPIMEPETMKPDGLGEVVPLPFRHLLEGSILT